MASSLLFEASLVEVGGIVFTTVGKALVVGGAMFVGGISFAVL